MREVLGEKCKCRYILGLYTHVRVVRTACIYGPYLRMDIWHPTGYTYTYDPWNTPVQSRGTFRYFFH